MQVYFIAGYFIERITAGSNVIIIYSCSWKTETQIQISSLVTLYTAGIHYFIINTLSCRALPDRFGPIGFHVGRFVAEWTFPIGGFG